MRLLIFSDIHSDLRALQRLMDTEADYYFCAGDLVSWARGLDKAAEVMQPKADRVFLIPGNHESERDIEGLCGRFGFRNMHGQTMELEGHRIAALGYSTPTPFDTPGEYSEAEMAERLGRFREYAPDILICHAPPQGTPLDRAGNGQHFGSRAVGEFLAEARPQYFFCGHIHEAEGVRWEMNGSTVGVNVGKRGYLLEL